MITDMELMRKMNMFARKNRADGGHRMPPPPMEGHEGRWEHGGPHGGPNCGRDEWHGHGGPDFHRGGNERHGGADCGRDMDERRGEPHDRPERGRDRDRGRGPKRPPLSREYLLVLISENPEGIRQKAIADKVGMNQSSTSEMIDKLEGDGYIVRKVDPTDKRATLLFLTELGEARSAEVKDERDAMFAGIFDVLSDEERQVLSDILDKLLGEKTQENG